MNILEETLLEDLDMILLEEYPPIFMQLNKKVRDIISNTFAVGPNSIQKDITRDEVRKYDNGLIIGTDEDFTPIAYMVGTNIGMLPSSPYDIGEIDSRPKLIKKSAHLFYISPDEKGWNKIHDREKRGAFEKPEYVETYRKRPTDGFGVKVKRVVSKENKEEFRKRINKYVEKKIESYRALLEITKKSIANELEKIRKTYIEEIKTKNDYNISYQYNKKIKTIINNIREFDEKMSDFSSRYKEYDNEKINQEINEVSTLFEKLKKSLGKVK